MHCPNCGSSNHKQQVKDTSHTEAGRIVRRRRCLGCGHDYRTVEQFSETGLRVLKSDGRVVAFSREAIRTSLTESAVRKYISVEIDALIDTVIGDVYPKANGGVVPSSVIGESVLGRLRKFDEVSQIRFALVHIGRLDRSDRRPGWSSIEDMRQWLADVNPKLKYSNIPSRTVTVYKRRGGHEDYSRTKIEEGVKIAAKGRGSIEMVDRMAKEVATDVEDAIGDQPIITSGQISVEIMRSLRFRDEIAYLRFASTTKQFRDVADYEGEAMFLRRRSKYRQQET